MGHATLPALGPRHSGKGGEDRLHEAERMLNRYIRGARHSDLMVEFGVSRETVKRRLKLALDARLALTVDEYRAKENEHLDDLVARWEQHIAAADEMIRLAETGPDGPSMSRIDQALAHRAKALDSLLRVAERRARLNGTDAPVQANVTVTDLTPTIDAEVAALAAQIVAGK